MSNLKMPWQGLGAHVEGAALDDALRMANLDWTMDKIPIAQVYPDGIRNIPGEYSLSRSSDKSHISLVGASYKPVQNRDIVRGFAQFCRDSAMRMTHLGSLKGGKQVWALARIGYDFSVDEADPIEGYLLLHAPFHSSSGFGMLHASVRGLRSRATTVVRPLGKLFGDIYAESYSSIANEAIEAAKALSESYEEDAEALSKAPADREEVRKYIVSLFDARAARSGAPIESATRAAKMAYDALDDQPGSRSRGMKGTWWGALNAIAYTVDHQIGRDRDKALSSAWFGSGAALKARALHSALEASKRDQGGKRAC